MLPPPSTPTPQQFTIHMNTPQKPLAIVTGVGRKIGIGAAIAQSLAQDGWTVAITHWHPYDASMPWQSGPDEPAEILGQIRQVAPDSISIEADLSDPATPAQLFDQVEQALGPADALVLSHCMSIDSDILTTTLESFDAHFAINTRSTWLMVREFGQRFKGEHGSGRIVSLTSDHTAGNLPYGASKGAMDRIVLAASHEFKQLGITANVINPGPVDTGWMDDGIKEWAVQATPLGRLGTSQDSANLVRFLCSAEGGWINGQLLMSNGGIQ